MSFIKKTVHSFSHQILPILIFFLALLSAALVIRLFPQFPSAKSFVHSFSHQIYLHQKLLSTTLVIRFLFLNFLHFFGPPLVSRFLLFDFLHQKLLSTALVIRFLFLNFLHQKDCPQL